MKKELTEFANRIGIWEHDKGIWVHHLCGVVNNIESCETETDLVCRLMTTYKSMKVMYLYTIRCSSGTSQILDSSEFYFVDVKNPTDDAPVNQAVYVKIHGVGSEETDVIGKIVWSRFHENDINSRYFMVKFPKQYFIEFLEGIQCNGIGFILINMSNVNVKFNVVEVEEGSPSNCEEFYPTEEWQKRSS